MRTPAQVSDSARVTRQLTETLGNGSRVGCRTGRVTCGKKCLALNTSLIEIDKIISLGNEQLTSGSREKGGELSFVSLTSVTALKITGNVKKTGDQSFFIFKSFSEVKQSYL